jgi:uncharacterized protein (DUF924 family)
LRKTPRLTPLARGFDRQATDAERPFFYFPFMHAQALAAALLRAVPGEHR